jgi:gliding motility-associated protein GldE
MPDPPDPTPSFFSNLHWIPADTIYSVVIVLLLLLAAITTSSESAFFSLNPAEKDKLKAEDSKVSKIILDLLSNPRELIALLLISINFVNVGIVILSTMILDDVMIGKSETTKFLVEVFGITLMILITGEVIPKIYGAGNAMKVARVMALPMNYVRRMPPISWLKWLLLNGSSFIGKMGKKSIQISSDELEYAIAITKEESTSEDEHKLLEGIVKFGKTEADQIMTPRIEVAAISEDLKFNEVIRFVIDAGYSRIPVYKETSDNIIGIIYIKDLLPFLGQTEDFDWKSLLREPFFVPENKKIDDLLQEFRTIKMHMAIVVDEYGGANGIVTLEDILEEIVGDITDEYDEEDIEFKRLDDKNFLFEGRTALKDFYKVIDIDGDAFENDKGASETLGGFIVERSGRILKNKEFIVHSNVKLSVESSDKRRIKWIKVEILSSQD